MEVRITRTPLTVICSKCGEVVEVSLQQGADRTPFLKCFIDGCQWMGRNDTAAERAAMDMKYRPTLPAWF